MKRLSSKTNSVIAKTLATSILITSCAQNTDIEPLADNKSDDFNKDTVNHKGVPISLSLSEETKQSLKEIAPLVQEIIDNPQIAQELSENPKAFCEKRGYAFTIDLDDAIFKVIIALGNQDINEALKNNNFEQFIQICSKMHLLEEGQKVKLNTVFQNEEEQYIFQAIAQQLNGETIETRSVALWVAVSVVVVIAIILTYTVGIGDDINDQPANDALIKDSLQRPVRDSILPPQKLQAFLHYNNPNHSILDVWTLKNKQVNTYLLVSKYKTFLAQQIVSYLKENKPTLFEEFSETQISEFLKKNMIV